ncbi:MAG: DUF1295 domain-containing protein, partial [Bacteroidia bacterium]|nr:DUF1295 domain-containing protein [Bacteroidia bacterium]
MENIVRLALLLIVTIVVFPVLAFQYDQSMTEMQWALLKESGMIMLGVAAFAFVLAEITKNYSQTDKLWGLTPILFVWHLAWRSGFDERLLLMAALVTVWGLRLSYNFSRRGGFSWKFWEGEEDYRWSVLQNMKAFKGKPFRWTLFNLFFIALYQHALIWLFCMPALVAIAGIGTPLGLIDYLAAGLFLLFVAGETAADQQQYDFQTEKYRRKAANEPLDGDYLRGFRSTGLWGLVRHPNYACEQSIWITFYLFGVAATDNWVNWSLVGALLLLLLFRGSSDFSEKISLDKYPAYAEYQKAVGRFLP